MAVAAGSESPSSPPKEEAEEEEDEGPSLPGAPMGRRAVCSRPYFVVLMVFAHLYVLNVLGLLLFVHISADDGGGGGGGGGGEPGREAQDSNPAPAPPMPSAPPHLLPRLEGIKVGHKQKVELVPNKIHFMKTLSLKPLLFEQNTALGSRWRQLPWMKIIVAMVTIANRIVDS